MYKVVIVDDEQQIVEGITNLFPWEQRGFEVAAFFQSPVEAYQYLKVNKADVLLCDIEMPEVNGIELIEKLNESGIKVVFISGFNNYEYFRGAIRNKVEDYLLKPIKYHELSECLQKIKDQLDRENTRVEEEKPQGYYDQIIDGVKAYIEESYQNASLEKAAEKTGLSAGYLSRIFKEYSGKGFLEYLTDVRMKKACEFLDDYHNKSYDVAYHVGYENPKNFSRAFKAYYGKTPSEYRKQNTNETT
jgi:YesN/AraC family two-component response regulator